MPHKNRRRMIFLAAAAVPSLAIGVLVQGPRENANSEDCEPNERGRIYEHLPAPAALTTDADIVHTRIGGRDFYVPRNYFRHPQIGCGAEESGMLLRVLLPDLEPYSGETAAEFAAQRGFGDKLSILLSSNRRRPLDELVVIYLEEDVITPPSEATGGMFHGQHRHGDDIYFSRSDGGITRLLRCSPFAPNRGASCGHHFRYESHDVQITYGRQHLPNWRSIQQSVEQLLSSFIDVAAQ